MPVRSRNDVLAELWLASDDELRTDEIAIPYFRRWRAAVEDGSVERTVGGALTALRLDLGAAPAESPTWQALQPWVERLQAAHEESR
jgi:hypothetical protein